MNNNSNNPKAIILYLFIFKRKASINHCTTNETFPFPFIRGSTVRFYSSTKIFHTELCTKIICRHCERFMPVSRASELVPFSYILPPIAPPFLRHSTPFRGPGECFPSSCMAIIIITARSASTSTPAHELTSGLPRQRQRAMPCHRIEIIIHRSTFEYM